MKPSWDEYFMGIAEAASARSPDPTTKVGCVIVDENRHIISLGYNGSAPGINTEKECEIFTKPKQYEFILHAEMNAIAHATKSVRGCTLYSTLECCHECAKLIISSGIKRVWFKEARPEFVHSREIFNMASISCTQLPNKEEK
jgi:dCMP deaminase